MTTVEQVCKRYLTAELQLKPRSRAENTRQINVYIIPAFGYMNIADVQYEDIEKLHADLDDTPYQANRVLALLSTLFTLAEKWRLRPHGSNPCRGVTRFLEVSRKRYLTDAEAPLLSAALRKRETTHPREVAFIYLLMFTGARPDEIERAEAAWIAGNVLRLPESKTGARSVYLAPQVAGILAALPTGQPTLLGIKTPRKLWDTIRKEIGAPTLRLYDLRHTFASAALAEGYTLDQIGELLGHASAQTTKRYAHLLPSKAHEVAAGASARIERMLNVSMP